ncbi:MAG: GIY-YIG nuclease family protein [Bacteroidetes bacterium]|nr:GIY-YIG nuclease family protein [Bacteroidota bacterium]MBS1739033.1 GIY-YIG nuclease family protein [Bacteroidota bacterium]
MPKTGYVYILTNKYHTVYYTGVTNSLVRRIREHKDHFNKGSFTDRYNVTKIVYYEVFSEIRVAIAREKQIKKYGRPKKVALIESFNPDWNDLWEFIVNF